MKDLYKAFDELNAERSIETLVKKADLIARGTVEKTWREKEDIEHGTPKKLSKAKININRILKGKLDNNKIIITMIARNHYNSLWQTNTPSLKVGEEWFLFLKWADEPGYYPFAGVNGMFKIAGDRLIRRNIDDFVLKKSPKSLEKEIKVELSKER